MSATTCRVCGEWVGSDVGHICETPDLPPVAPVSEAELTEADIAAIRNTWSRWMSIAPDRVNVAIVVARMREMFAKVPRLAVSISTDPTNPPVDPAMATRLDDAMTMLADLRENRDAAVDALEAAIADLEFMGAKERARIHRMTLNNVKLMDDQLEVFDARHT